MHYHVVLAVDGQEDFTATFGTWKDAQETAESISRQCRDWVPRRYPGRSSRAGEVAVYLDRRAGRRVIRQELAIIRCHVDGSEPWPACDVWRPRCGGAERSGSQHTRARVGRRGGSTVARTSARYGSASRPASVAAKALHGAASSASPPGMLHRS